MKYPTFKRTLAASAAAAMAISLAACGSDDDNDNGNGDDDTITLYSGRNETLVQPLIDRFTEQTGIEVNVHYYNTAEAASLLLEEGEATNADIFLAQDAGALGAVSKAGLFGEIDSDLTADVDPRFKADDDTWVGLTGRSRVLIYNPDEIGDAELPDSVLDITDGPWAGNVGIAPLNGSFQAFVTALRVAEGDDAAAQWLQDMADTDAPLEENNGAIIDAVVNGDIPAGLVNHYYIWERVVEAGVELDEFEGQLHYFAAGDAGALVNISGVGVLNRASDNDNVRAFVEYLLSEEGQNFFVTETYEYPVVTGIAGPEGQPSLEELNGPDINLNDLDDLETTVQMIQEAGLA
ncbi:iron ABC transporter substrate-binding protein [Natronoglycomyces albus]|uniref:Iron ABC transporter substrate-binding protein n=1 Tax=Natronoglycomyces albus TaxID=2811108 RepID=A0A895XKD1_9ACTN|nr:iron ABC transporter substrate-binding protein [Natronoglycomyces albus]QSB03889.1 iron ABC transporter substrate-binding protein [Natronoglycomyces albus]